MKKNKMKREENNMNKLGRRCKLIGILSSVLGAILLAAIIRFNVAFKLNLDLFLLGPIFIFLGIFLYIVGKDLEKIYRSENE
jgi:sterol desaturase/sphingolipid hydroxylase (fatty acid hydroxylase superfamily)